MGRMDTIKLDDSELCEQLKRIVSALKRPGYGATVNEFEVPLNCVIVPIICLCALK